MLLRAIEMSLYSSKVEAVSVAKELSIEHVIPQTWQTHWPLSPDLTSEQRQEAESARNARIHFLGNLTLVTRPLNTRPSRMPHGH
jgi:hypothetical protein